MTQEDMVQTPKPRRWKSSLVPGLALATIGAITVAAAPGPAAAALRDGGATIAATQCYPNSRVLKRPGTSVQRTVTIELCVQRVGDGSVRAYAHVAIRNKTGTADIVYDATLNVRLERYDTVIESEACSMGYEINDDRHDWSWICAAPTKYTTATGGWTADGVVYYDIVGDGKGTQTWDLHGSPVIT